MSLLAQYDTLRQNALRKLAQGEAELDGLLDSPQDTRRGITLLTRPPAPIIAGLEAIMADFQRLEPSQYYYPATDIHLTIMSIISCYSGFTLAVINPADYCHAVRTILQACPPFTLTFSGLTASPGGIMVQGFPADDSLENLRNATRQYFQHAGAGLLQSIDQRYSIHTAHSTIIRFRHQLMNTTALVEKITYYAQQFIGTFEVNTVELVYNDWYQRAATTVVLEKYRLGAG